MHKGSFPLVKQWWNSDETVMKQVESAWIRAMKQWWNMLNQDESAMQQFVSWSWNTVKNVESGWNMIMKYLESGWSSVSWSWNILNQDETVCFMVTKHLESGWNCVFHGHETSWIRMKLCVSWSWNTLFHANGTHWIRDGDHRHRFFIDFLVHGVSLRCFMLFHCCFMRFHCCFIAVSLLFHLLFHCCFTVFHCSVSRCFKVFHCHVSSCFMTMKQVQWERALSDVMAEDKSGCDPSELLVKLFVGTAVKNELI